MHEVVHATKVRNFPNPLFVHRASIEQADAFFAKRHPSARAISDTEGKLFSAFGLTRGTLLQLLGPRALSRGLIALLKGNLVGRPTGNQAQMPGAFLTCGNQILWEHRASHAGEQPNLESMMQLVIPGAPVAEQQLSRRDKAALAKLERQHLKLLTVARDLQRNGDIQAFAKATAEASKVEEAIDALKRPLA